MRLLLLCLLTTSLTFSVNSQWEVYRNLDFQQGAKDSLTGVAYWQTKPFVEVAPSYVNEKTKENPYLKLTGNYEENKPGYVYQQHPVAVTKYTKLRISARIKGENISEGTGGIYCYTRSGEEWLQYQNLKQEAVSGTTDWKKVSLEIWVAPRADRLRIGASLDGKGTLYMDDFEVEEIQKEDCEMEPKWTAFMQECMDLIGNYSVYKEKLDTAQLMRNWVRLASCSDSIDGVHFWLQTILRSIDNHSFFWNSEIVNNWQNTSSQEAAIPFATGYHIDEEYAYIWMPHMNSGDSITQILFADKMHQLIDSLDHPKLKGWVLDLRDNTGGNCWPMLAGIGPILGDSVCGYFKEETQFQDWEYKNGGSYLEGDVVTQVGITPYVPHLKNPPVAVLTSQRTGSSGEIVTLAFKNRPLSQSFGLKTGGYTTGNVNHTLSDGSMLFLAQSVYCDRKKNLYRHGVEPDVYVNKEESSKEDNQLKEAMNWLRGLDK